MNPDDLTLEEEACKGHKKAAFATARYFARAFNKVPMVGTAKFGSFKVEILTMGISIKEGNNLIGFVPSKELRHL